MSAIISPEGRVSEMLMRVKIIEDAMYDPTGWEVAKLNDEGIRLPVDVIIREIGDGVGATFGPITMDTPWHGVELYHNGMLVYVVHDSSNISDYELSLTFAA